MSGFNKNIFAALSCLLTLPFSVNASPTEQGLRARAGEIVCGGNHFVRLAGTEAHTTSYVIRNYDQGTAVRIRRMRIYDANGNLIKDYAPLPVAFNNVMGGIDSTLEPNQTALYRTNELLDDFLGKNFRPVQVRIQWSADSSPLAPKTTVLVPEIVWVRVSRKRIQTGVDAAGNPVYKVDVERARHLNNCRLVKVIK